MSQNQQQLIYKYGQAFYPYLVNNALQNRSRFLYQDYPEHSLRVDILVYWDCPITDDKTKRLFTRFHDYIALYNWIQRIPFHSRSMFETITGSRRQKPHFDLEIMQPEPNIANVLDECIAACEKIFATWQYPLDLTRNILIYQSHSQPNAKKFKQSHHIVIDGYYHLDNVEARAFYERVCQLVKPEYRCYVDHSVYGKNQQFRMLNCQKYQSNRPKLFMDKWYYRGKLIEYVHSEAIYNPRHRELLELSASLCSYTIDCKPLPRLHVPVKHDIFTSGTVNNGNSTTVNSGQLNASNFKSADMDLHKSIAKIELSKEQVLDAITKLAQIAGVRPSDRRFPYRLHDVSGGLIILQRVLPSKCRICEREHENENPYMYIKQGAIMFNCRRNAEDKELYVGPVLQIAQPINNTKTTISNNIPSTTIPAATAINNADNNSIHDINHLSNGVINSSNGVINSSNGVINSSNEVINSSNEVINSSSCAAASSNMTNLQSELLYPSADIMDVQKLSQAEMPHKKRRRRPNEDEKLAQALHRMPILQSIKK